MVVWEAGGCAGAMCNVCCVRQTREVGPTISNSYDGSGWAPMDQVRASESIAVQEVQNRGRPAGTQQGTAPGVEGMSWMQINSA